MAASSNDSFGLKIATALSIALSVALLVSVYFLNSSYTQEREKNAENEKKIATLTSTQRTTTDQANEYRMMLGYGQIEEFDAAKAQMKKDVDQIKADLMALGTETTQSIGEFQKKAQSKGVPAAQFDNLKDRTRELIDSFVNNPDQSNKASLVRMKDLLVNQTKLNTALTINAIDLRRDLELVNKVNDDAKKVVENNLTVARAELDEAIKKDEDARAELVADNRKKAEDLATAENQISNITNKLSTETEKRDKSLTQLNSVLRTIRNKQAEKEDVLSKPGGRVTYVDYGQRTVRISVNRNQGVTPLMRFSIFDKNAAGITSEKPKASVEIVKVGDPAKGENDSEARIVQTYEKSDPIRYNDLIYSVGWSYDHPQRFDLIGKIDVNRDGRDDRADLIRMIEAAGGIVEFDLPPPNTDRSPGQAAVARAFKRLGEPVPPSTGRSSGKISGLSFAYVIDRRQSLVTNQPKRSDPSKDDAAFVQEESAAIREATDNAVRPLPLEKLLNMLGYDYESPLEGRREAYDKGGVNDLIKPQPNKAPTAPPQGGTEETPQ